MKKQIISHSKMTDKDYVIRAAEIKNLTLNLPKKGVHGIYCIDYNKKDKRGLYPCVIDAQTWKESRAQLDSHYREN
jgi:hypothetical protein